MNEYTSKNFYKMIYAQFIFVLFGLILLGMAYITDDRDYYSKQHKEINEATIIDAPYTISYVKQTERDEDGREYKRTVTIYHQEVNYSYIDEENNQTVYEKAYGYETRKRSDLYKVGSKAKLYIVTEGDRPKLYNHKEAVRHYLLSLFIIFVGASFTIIDILESKSDNSGRIAVKYRNPNRHEYNSADDLEAQVRAIQNNRNNK